MARVLIRIKVAAMRGSLRGWSLAGLTLVALLGLAVAVLTVRLGWAGYEHPGAAVDILAFTVLTWTFMWIVGPALPGGGDETLRPEHFTLLPIRPAALARGLLAASFVGLGPLLTLIAFGSIFAYGLRHGLLPAAVGLVATLLQLAMAVLVGRVVSAGFGVLLATRRGREAGLVLLVALLCLPGFSARWIGETAVPALTGQTWPALGEVLRALPTGWGIVAVDAADRSSWAVAAGALAGLLLVNGLLVAAWTALLVRRTTRAAVTSGGRRSGADVAGRRILPVTPLGAVVGKELRLWYRHTFRLIFLAAPVAESCWVLFVPGIRSWVGVSYVAWLFLRMLNMYSIDAAKKSDGPDVWTTILVPRAARPDVRGRQLAFLLTSAPIAALLMAVAAWLDGTADAVAIGSLLAVLGAATGAFPLWSVRFPFRIGRPGAAPLLMANFLFFAPVLFVTMVPVLLTAGYGPDWAAVPVGLAVGASLAWWLGRLAYRRLDARGPELLSSLRGVDAPAAA